MPSRYISDITRIKIFFLFKDWIIFPTCPHHTPHFVYPPVSGALIKKKSQSSKTISCLPCFMVLETEPEPCTPQATLLLKLPFESTLSRDSGTPIAEIYWIFILKIYYIQHKVQSPPHPQSWLSSLRLNGSSVTILLVNRVKQSL